MKGIISEINWSRGMVAILTVNGDYSVFELMGNDDLEINDEVFWRDDTALGSETIKNITKGIEMEVYFQNHWVPRSQLKKQLLI